MEQINIYGANRYETYTKVREACRGIVVRERMLLMSYETKTGLWMIPGGGVEGAETLEACCTREISEETGFLTDAQEQYLTIQEYYEDYLYKSHYFICRVTGETQRKLTRREREVGMEPRWVPLDQGIAIFSRHEDYIDQEEKHGIYLREYQALKAYLAQENAKL